MHERFTVRPARPGDHAEFARFFRELGHDDPVPDRARWEAEMMPHTIFLEEAGARIGYAYVEVFGDRGYVRHVVVDPGCRGRGVGRALMEAIAERLRERGSTQWELNVRHDNRAAIRLYEILGLRAQYSTCVVQLDWKNVSRLPAPETTPRAFDVDARDDERIERAFGMPGGQIARLRDLPAQVLVRLAGVDGSVCGFARFDPEFPGAFPFRVANAVFARTLLDALRPHARSERPWIQLVVEDDALTTRAALDAGARLRFEIVHMRGEIPRA